MERKQGFDGMVRICPVHDLQSERGDSMMREWNAVNSQASDAAH